MNYRKKYKTNHLQLKGGASNEDNKLVQKFREDLMKINEEKVRKVKKIKEEERVRKAREEEAKESIE